LKEDPMLPTGTATNADFSHSGYDKGHQGPASDFEYDLNIELECFYFTNICPQNPVHNRGIWEHLENQVRLWTLHKDSLLIITGPIIGDSCKTIGKNNITVPDAFFKIVFDFKDTKNYKAIGFIMLNQAIPEKNPVKNYVATIASIEKASHLTFFKGLKVSEDRTYFGF
jgi:endonuclease G